MPENQIIDKDIKSSETSSPQNDSDSSWLDVFPDEVKSDPNWTKHKTPEGFVKYQKERDTLIGRKGVILPTEKSTPEEYEKFYNEIGRPAKPEEYKLSDIKELHPSIQVTPESKTAYQMIAHKYGLTNKQADGLNQFLMDVVNRSAMEQDRREQEATKNAETAMRKEWGDKYDSNLKMVTKNILKLGGQETLDAMGGEKGLGNNPLFIKMLGNVFSMISEDQMGKFKAINDNGSGNETKEQALSKIKEMNNDMKHAIWNERDPNHEEAINERNRLYQIAYGE